jgi:hypothetical protein
MLATMFGSLIVQMYGIRTPSAVSTRSANRPKYGTFAASQPPRAANQRGEVK